MHVDSSWAVTTGSRELGSVGECGLVGFDSGDDVKAIQQMLGHASAQMTLDRYAGLFDSHLDDVADRMELLVQVEESDSEVTGVKDPQTQARPLFTKPHVTEGKKVVAL